MLEATLPRLIVNSLRQIARRGFPDSIRVALIPNLRMLGSALLGIRATAHAHGMTIAPVAIVQVCV
jgi:hypothetical protein